MVFIQPEKRIADQEIFNLVAAVIENERAPVLMFPQAGIFMLKEAASVIAGQAMSVLGKMSGHPIQNHSDSGLVAAIDKIPKLVGISKPARRGVVVHHLITPGTVEGMLHHRHELNMCEAHFLYIGNQAVPEFTVA